MSDVLPVPTSELVHFVLFLVGISERFAAGDDVPAEWLDVLATLDPMLIDLLADVAAARNAEAMAARHQPHPNVVRLFPIPGHAREPATTPSFAR